MDPVKEAFLKIKEEINILKTDISSLKRQLNNLQTHNPTYPTQNVTLETLQTDTQTHNPTYPTQNQPLQSLYLPNLSISTRNEGVQTNKLTDTQIHRQTHNLAENNQNSNISEFKEAKNILNSLDNIKKGIRIRFKRLTSQEMLVFSHLYALEDEKYDEITYKVLAKKMNLTESSIRDYINRLISKGIPIQKTRLNNKIILLGISEDLKNIASLHTIQELRQI